MALILLNRLLIERAGRCITFSGSRTRRIVKIFVGLALDLAQELGVVPLEVGVAEDDFFARPLALVEVVHIELADERVYVTVFEIVGERIVRKVSLVDYFEAEAVPSPLDGPLVLRLRQNLVQLLQKSRDRLVSLFLLFGVVS